MPPKRSQPARKAREGTMDNVLGEVLDELKQLRAEVNSIRSKVEIMQDLETESAPTSNIAVASAQGGDTDTSLPVNQLPGIQAAMSANNSVIHPSPIPSSSLPLTDIVPDNVRKDIVRGKDVNLCQLLIPARERGSFTMGREITIGEDTVNLKPLGDKRMSKMLTVQEFVKAFNIYKNILCEAFPHRRAELDRYMSHIIDISAKYQGFAHYEYHLEFSARAAYYKEHHNSMIDWGIIDDRLLTQIVAGRKAITCTLCGGYDHVSTFCHLAANEEGKQRDTSTIPCRFYNQKEGCGNRMCRYSHRCSSCSTLGHGATTCMKKVFGKKQ